MCVLGGEARGEARVSDVSVLIRPYLRKLCRCREGLPLFHTNHCKCSDLVYTAHPALVFLDAQQSLAAGRLVIISPF